MSAAHPTPYDLVGYAAGTLTDPAAAAAIADHVVNCGVCAAEVADYAALSAALHVPAVADPAADAALWAAVTSRLGLDDQPPQADPTVTTSTATPAAADAAAVAPGAYDTPDADGGVVVDLGRRRAGRRGWTAATRVAAVAAVVIGLVVVGVGPGSVLGGRGGLATAQAAEVLQAAAAQLRDVATARLRSTGTTTFTTRPLGVYGPAVIQIELDGQGAIRFGHGSTERVRTRPVRLPEGLPLDASDIAATVTEGITIGNDTWLRQDDGQWRPHPGRPGPISAAVSSADLPERLLAAAEGAVTDAGRVHLDGVDTRQVTYPVSFDAAQVSGDDQRGTVTGTVTVWVGVDDAVVHQVRFVGSEDADGILGLPIPGRYDYELTVALYDFGAPVTLTPPPTD